LDGATARATAGRGCVRRRARRASRGPGSQAEARCAQGSPPAPAQEERVRPLPTSFFRRPAEIVARDLLGSTIVSQLGRVRLSGIIRETEAYLGHDDPASHAYLGRKHNGNLNLYGPPGTWYVYRSYGIHWCANLVCGRPSPGGAVLLRGVFPGEGLEVM